MACEAHTKGLIDDDSACTQFTALLQSIDQATIACLTAREQFGMHWARKPLCCRLLQTKITHQMACAARWTTDEMMTVQSVQAEMSCCQVTMVSFTAATSSTQHIEKGRMTWAILHAR
jgi:hypothetical protein